MDVQVVSEVYGGLPERVVGRAREVLRLVRAKSSMQLDMAMPVACLVVACRALDEPIDVKKMAALLHISARSLDQTARKIANVVNAKSEQKITPTSLCVRHGCAAITELVNRVYDAYQVVAQRLARGKNGSGGGVRLFDPTDPVFAAACLFVCSKRAKLRVDRPKLLADISANPRAFEAIVSSIEIHCRESLAGSVIVSRASRGATDAAAARSQAVQKERKPAAMTKAAQRAAHVLDKAVAKKDARDREVNKTSKATTREEPKGGVTQQQYQAWRTKVLALRRNMQNEGQTEVPRDHLPVRPSSAGM